MKWYFVCVSLWYYDLLIVYMFFFFKQKTAYEMRISDWSSDVCSSDLTPSAGAGSHPVSCAEPQPDSRPQPRELHGLLPVVVHRDRSSHAEGHAGSEDRKSVG